MTRVEVKTAEFVLTEMEQRSYFEKFGHMYWSEEENIVCLPYQDLNIYVREKLQVFFGVDCDTEYIVVRMDKALDKSGSHTTMSQVPFQER